MCLDLRHIRVEPSGTDDSFFDMAPHPRNALRALALRCSLIWRDAHTPGQGQARVRNTGSASTVRSLGRVCQRAAIRPAPVAAVGTRVALDLTVDH
mgnify:CR=1 FL=1